MWSRTKKMKNLLWFTEQFYILNKAGLGFAASLKALQQSCEDKAFRQNIAGILKAIEEGKTFSQGLQKYPQFFDDFYVEMLKAAEATGSISTILLELQQFLRLKNDLWNESMRALTYPCIVMALMVILTMGLCFSVIPQFEAIFQSFHAPLPFITKILFASVNMMRAHSILIVILIALAIFGFKKLFKGKFRHFKKDLRIFKVPLVGPFYHHLLLLRFFKVLGLSLKAGLSMQESMKLLQKMFKPTPFAMAIASIQYDLQAGRRLSDLFKKEAYFPIICQSFMRIAEEVGSIDEQALRLSEIFTEQVHASLAQFKTLLEPLLMLITGVIVGGVVMAIYYPIFSMGAMI